MSAHPCCVLAAAHGMSCPGKLPELVVAEKRIEELEAALVAFAQAIDDSAATIARPCLCDETVGITTCQTCDATIEAYARELVAEQAILAMGREIAGRKP